MKTWYELAKSSPVDGTETIARSNYLHKLTKAARQLIDEGVYDQVDVEFLFIDRWVMDGPIPTVDESFETLKYLKK